MANRIEITTFRAYGKDDDSTITTAYRDGDPSDMKACIADELNLEVDEDGDILDKDGRADGEWGYITGESELVDGQILEHNGRRFRINITEVTE